MPILPIHVKLLLIAGTIFTAFIMGWVVHGWKYDANLKKALQATIDLQLSYDKYAREAAIKLQRKQADQVIVYRTIEGKIKNVTDNRICFADSNALSLWNSALTGDLPKATTRTPEKTSSSDTATDRQLLENVVANFEQAKQIRDQLNALIDWYEGIEQVKH